MKIFIITMEDPVYTLAFIREIIEKRQPDILGIAIVKGNRFTLPKKRSKLIYLLSLFVIMGVTHFIKFSWLTIRFKVRKKLAHFLTFIEDPSLLHFARQKGIKTFTVTNPNNKELIRELKEMNPDIIINQSQNLIKGRLLRAARIGVINRHNALLPKNRGRLAPFWALYKNEKETGVSIHFVEEGIDCGDIIVQERFPIDKKDNFNSLVRKNYQAAPRAMFKALALLEKGRYELIKNDDTLSTYNSVPTLKQALTYRWARMKRLWN
ncbi:MAG TPA: formyltransferase family protein [Candidatus Kapabacteria bacterium]|nr:formyltransferase family protein [Candidatus Kapabacteria bacterium]